MLPSDPRRRASPSASRPTWVSCSRSSLVGSPPFPRFTRKRPRPTPRRGSPMLVDLAGEPPGWPHGFPASQVNPACRCPGWKPSDWGRKTAAPLRCPSSLQLQRATTCASLTAARVLKEGGRSRLAPSEAARRLLTETRRAARGLRCDKSRSNKTSAFRSPVLATPRGRGCGLPARPRRRRRVRRGCRACSQARR